MNSLIEQLKAKGFDTSWYKPGAEPDNKLEQKCSRFSIYLLAGEHSYTVNTDGSKFKKWRKLKQPQEAESYFCVACKKAWDEWDKAINHMGEK